MMNRECLFLASFTVAALLSLTVRAGQQSPPEKPEVVLNALPLIAFAPARVKFSVDLRDGSDDYEEFYCAAVEWDWDDGTTSSWTRDCDPYRPGKSRIMRHFAGVHTYDLPDEYHPTFRLKKRNKVVAHASVDIEVHGGGPSQ